MANLNTKTISAGVTDILAIEGGVPTGGTGTQVKSGNGLVTALYLTDGEVGIGTANVNKHLCINNTVDETAGASKGYVAFDGDDGRIFLRDNGDTVSGWGINHAGGDNGYLAFQYASATKLAITSLGRIDFPSVDNTAPTTLLPGTTTLRQALWMSMDGDESYLEYGHISASETFTQFRITDNNDSDRFRIYIDEHRGDAYDRIPLDVRGDQVLLAQDGGNVGIGIMAPTNRLTVSPLQYTSPMNASQELTTVTAVSGTPFTDAMVGSQIVYADDSTSGKIMSRTDATHVEVATSRTVSAQLFKVHFQGLHVKSADGNVGIGTYAPSTHLHAFQGLGSCQITAESDGLATTELAHFTALAKRAGGSDRRASIGVYYTDTSGAGGANESCGYIRMDTAGGASNFLWFDTGDDLMMHTEATSIGGTTGIEIADMSSDERLKDISADAFPYGLAEINSLTPIKFKWKKSPEKGNKLGFGAQTSQSILPEVVKDTGICLDGYTWQYDDDGAETTQVANSDDTKLSMSYYAIIPVLVKAIQELSAKVTALENA